MSILQKIARTTLADPGAGTTTQTGGRVYRVTTQVPLYREIQIPRADAGPGDRIVVERSYLGSIGNNITAGQVTRVYAVRRILVGYQSVTTTVVEPIITTPSAPPVVTPVPAAWDSTAWSIKALPQPLEATWKVGAFTAGNPAGGALVGLTFLAPEEGGELRNIIHGIKVEGGIAYAHTSPPDGVEPAPGSGAVFVPSVVVSAGQVLRMTVVQGVVRMYANGVQLAMQPSYLGNQPVHLAAVLYDARDTVEDATLEALPISEGVANFRVVARGASYAYAEGSVTLRIGAEGEADKNFLRLRVYAKGGTRDDGDGVARLRVSAEGYADYMGLGSGSASIGPIVSLGSNYAYATGTGLLVLSAYGDGGPPTTNLFGRTVLGGQMQVSTATFPHRGFYAQNTVGGGFSATIQTADTIQSRTLADMKFKASRVYREQLLTRIAGGARLDAARVLDVVVVGRADVRAPLSGILIITGTLAGRTSLAAGLSSGRTTDAQLSGGASVRGNWVPNQVLHAALSALVRSGLALSFPGENLSVWSVNDATGGSTAYEQFPFNSFACIGERYYGAAEGGIFELTGNLDGQAPIDAYVNLGKQDFGVSTLKGIPNAYLTVSSEGLMQVRVTTPEGQQYTYRTRRSDDHMRVQRADFGRGLRAHYLGLEIMNEGGADFQMESAEFLINELSRRI